MRKLFALSLCVVYLSGCANFRSHLADGPGDALHRGAATTVRYAPTVAVYAAFAAAWSSIFGDDCDDDFDDFDE